LSAGAVKHVLTEFAPKFARETGDRAEFSFGTIGAVRRRLENGETADIVIGTAPAIAQMEQSGLLVAGSRIALGRTHTGICVRRDAPMPDISTPDRFREAMLDAKSIALTDPQAGGTSGIFLMGLLRRLGIAETVGRKAVLCADGDEVVEKVAAGAAAIGSTFVSEIVPAKAVKLVAPLPAAIGNATDYAAAIMAASSKRPMAEKFLAMLSAPLQRGSWTALGFEPL
jgi:molybdate transport system substrate-binding protein